MVSAWIPGEPVAKGRPRVRLIGGRPAMYTPQTTRAAEERVAALWEHPMIEAGVAIRMTVVAHRGRPKGHLKKDGTLGMVGLRFPLPIKRPDLDNIVKLALDALNGVAFHDDCQVIELHAYSQWVHQGEPGILIEIEEIE